jgi:uncharacterized integral membrane protein
MKAGNLILGAGTALVVFLTLLNGATASLSLFGAHLSVPVGAVILISFLFGIACTFTLLISRFTARSTSNQKLLEWQVQDAKLLEQVKSDREKQLEAKIATLETALQKALKK